MTPADHCPLVAGGRSRRVEVVRFVSSQPLPGARAGRTAALAMLSGRKLSVGTQARLLDLGLTEHRILITDADASSPEAVLVTAAFRPRGLGPGSQ